MGQQQSLRVLLVGGAFMLTQLGSRRTTNDIDAVLKDVNDLTASSLSQRLKTGARTVATRNQIPARGNARAICQAQYLLWQSSICE